MADDHDLDEFTPIPQSREAFEWLSAFRDEEVEQSVMRMAGLVREIAPDCVALSLTIADDDLTFTVMADRPGASLLDAMQYLDGGPCISAVDEQVIIATSDLPTDEGRWQLFARAEGLAGISSTLSLPVIRDGRSIGGVNLYGATNDAFDGHHDELAEACGAWAAGAITNADLEFTTRVRAAATRDRLQDQGDVDVAVGVVAEFHDIQAPEARARIHSAASRASVSDAEFARFILESHADDLDRRF